MQMWQPQEGSRSGVSKNETAPPLELRAAPPCPSNRITLSDADSCMRACGLAYSGGLGLWSGVHQNGTGSIAIAWNAGACSAARGGAHLCSVELYLPHHRRRPIGHRPRRRRRCDGHARRRMTDGGRGRGNGRFVRGGGGGGELGLQPVDLGAQLRQVRLPHQPAGAATLVRRDAGQPQHRRGAVPPEMWASPGADVAQLRRG